MDTEVPSASVRLALSFSSSPLGIEVLACARLVGSGLVVGYVRAEFDRVEGVDLMIEYGVHTVVGVVVMLAAVLIKRQVAGRAQS